MNTVRTSSRNRFNEVNILLNYISSIENSSPTTSQPPEVKILRGLFFVHLYSSFERTVNDLVIRALLLIKSLDASYNHLELGFNVIASHNQIKSLKDCGYSKYLERSVNLFSTIVSNNKTEINETLFANTLQNVWYKTIIEVLNCFCINDLRADISTITTIDEVVDKRNAIAHGRESALEIGEKYKSHELRRKMSLLQVFSDSLIDRFEIYCTNKEFIQRPHLINYVTP